MGPTGRGHDPGGHRGGRAHPPLLDRVHAWRSQVRAVLHLPELVRHLDDDPRTGRLVRRALRGLGVGGPVLLPVDLLLVRATRGCGCRQEGVRGEPGRRCRLPGCTHARVLGVRHASVRRGLRKCRRSPHDGHGDRDHDPVARGCGGEVGPVAPAHLAARRHGGPHARVGTDPRRNDGDSGCLHGREDRRIVRHRTGLGRDRGGRRGRDRPCSPRPSPSRRTTSSGCWPTRPSANSATCSWPSAPPATSPGYSTS